MQVSHNHVITLHYQLKDDNGKILDKSYAGDSCRDDSCCEPMTYLHGLSNVNNIQRVPTKYLKHEGKLSVGQSIHVNTDNGVKPGTIIKLGKFNADVDMNHPLAGKILHFEVEIMDIRKATDKEIEDLQCTKGCCH